MGARACAAAASIAATGLLRVLFRSGAAVAAAALVLSPMHPAVAQQRGAGYAYPYTGTLKKINDSGVIVIGHRQNSPPFAFLDKSGKPVGYSLDLCEVVIEEINAELRKDVRIAYRPVTPENRLQLVSSGEVDLECGSTHNTAERRKLVAFSPTIFVTGTKLLVRRGSRILHLRDLQGKTIVLTRGTVHEAEIPKLAERQKLNIKFVYDGDHQESFQTVVAGKADAFAHDDVQLYGLMAETKSASEFRVVGEFLTYADYALVFRKDDPEFAEVVERAFHHLAGNREIVAIYEHWFKKPLPSGERLNMPMSPHLEELFRVQGLSAD
jgi:glutamate/aspartate transport system substrate-binding protein